MGPGRSGSTAAASADSASLGSISSLWFFFWTFLSKPDGEALEPASGLDQPLLGVVIEGGEMLLDSSF